MVKLVISALLVPQMYGAAFAHRFSALVPFVLATTGKREISLVGELPGELRIRNQFICLIELFMGMRIDWVVITHAVSLLGSVRC